MQDPDVTIQLSGGMTLSLRGRQPEAISIPNGGDCFASLAMTQFVAAHN
jgi:hypothetical protein